MEPPDGCICPITGVIFSEPVLTPDGHTYEQSAIREWLKHHTTSPVTNQDVGDCVLTPNWAIKKVVEDWLRGSGAQQDVHTPRIPAISTSQAQVEP